MSRSRRTKVTDYAVTLVLETFTLHTFSVHVDEDFAVALPDGSELTGRLIAAGAVGEAPVDGGRAPFSIVFRVPAATALPQGIYRFAHAAIGAFDLFLVPIQPDAAGPLYEAVFA